MTDFLTPAERSERMSRIKGKHTRPEVTLRKALHRLGMRYRLHGSGLPGKPDIVFPRYKAIVFVHGCFWHRHPGCSIATTPKSNTDFWLNKFQNNVARDIKVVQELELLGWRVFVVWECNLSSSTKTKSTAEHIAKLIKNPNENTPSTQPR
jgi:DNA mismatch endonuclease (patch repair protein)